MYKRTLLVLSQHAACYSSCSDSRSIFYNIRYQLSDVAVTLEFYVASKPRQSGGWLAGTWPMGRTGQRHINTRDNWTCRCVTPTVPTCCRVQSANGLFAWRATIAEPCREMMRKQAEGGVGDEMTSHYGDWPYVCMLSAIIMTFIHE